MFIVVDSLHLIFTAAFCCLLWTVQLLVYPQFLEVKGNDFANYHANHMRRMMPLVAVIFLGEGSMATISFAIFFQHQAALQSASVLLFAINTLLTFLLFVPLHRNLQMARTDSQLRSLVRLNWLRTLCSSARLFVVLLAITGE